VRNPVGRARGRLLRAVGAPKLPNLPSGRALLQNELRRAVPNVPNVRVTGRKRRGGRTDRDGDPAGPTIQWMGLLTLVALVVLTVAASCQHLSYAPPPPTTCADKVVWHDVRLSDC
jgi:hypothetical protein